LKKVEQQLKNQSKSTDKFGADIVLEPEFTLSFKRKLTQATWGFLNKSILASGEDGTLEIYGLDKKLEKSVIVSDGVDRVVKSFNITRDHSLLIACTGEGAKIYEAKTLKLLKNFKTEVPMNTGAISPLIYDEEPKYHAIIGGGVPARDVTKHKMGGFDVRLINLVYGEDLGSIAGHFGPVNSVAFHKDGRGFVSGGEEGVIRIFRFHDKYFKDFE